MKQQRERLTADVRRQQLERAVIELVCKLGFKSVTTDAVAKQAGVSKGLLWRYYNNLDDLMKHAAEGVLKKLEKIVADSLDHTLPVPDLLRQAIVQASQLPKHYRNELLAIQRIANNLQLPNGNLVVNESNSYEPLYANQAVIITRGQAEGSIKPGLDVKLVARMYQAAVDSMIDQLMHDPDMDAKLYADALADVFLGGIRISEM